MLCYVCLILCYMYRFPSQLLRKAFWTAVCATHPVQHQKAMKEVEKQEKSAYEQLKKLDPKVWTKAHFGTSSQADNVENNMSESFNAWIINERYFINLYLTIIYILDYDPNFVFS